MGEGDCYEVAANIVVNNPDADLLLCHGIAVGQGKIEGILHTHAWVEYPDAGIVIEQSNGNNVILPVDDYYKAGQLTNVVKYTRRETGKNLLKHRHYGPWDETLKGVGR